MGVLSYIKAATTGDWISAAGLAVTAFGTYKGIQQGKKAVQSQNRAIEAQSAASQKEAQFRDLQRSRQRQATTREYIAKRAKAVSIATQLGAATPGSSSIVGATGGLRSGTQGQLSFLDQAQGFSTDIASLNQQTSIFGSAALNYQSSANTWGGVGSIGQMVFNSSDTIANQYRKLTASSSSQKPYDIFGDNAGALNSTGVNG
jgi:hypothetical protein